VLVLLAPLFTVSQNADARTWNVPSPETPTIAAGIDSAFEGDTVMVAAGTYYEFNLEMPGWITLAGATGDPADVVIDAQQIGRILRIVEESMITIRDLTMRNGVASGADDDMGGAMYITSYAGALVENCIFENDSAKGSGGAVAVDWNSYPTFRRCVFTGNRAALDGGALSVLEATVILDSCRFQDNRAGRHGGAFDYGYGDAPGVRVTHCLFIENTAADLGGAACLAGAAEDTVIGCTFKWNHAGEGGGAVRTSYSWQKFADCRFIENSTDGWGGGLLFDNGSPRLLRCVVQDNVATSGNGGGVWVVDGGAELTDCVLSGNRAPAGGGIYYSGDESWDDLLLTRCTVAENTATTATNEGGAGLEGGAFGRIEFRNSIVAFNRNGPSVASQGEIISVFCSDIYGNEGGDWVDPIDGFDSTLGNFHADPMFCGPEANPDRPYMLQGISPCANDTCGLIGAEPVGCGFVKNWTGLGDGLNWEDEENWDPIGVPGPSDDVRITKQGTFSVDLSSPATVLRITVGGLGSSPTFTIRSNYLEVMQEGTNSYVMEIEDGAALSLAEGASFTNVGEVLLDGGDLIGEGAFVNGGDMWKQIVDVTSRIAIPFENRAEFPGAGALYVQGVLEIEGPFTNDGLIELYSMAALLLDPGDGPLRTDILTNDGYVLVGSGAAIELHQPTTVFLNLDPGVVELRGGDITGAGLFRNYGLVRKTDESPFTRALSRIAAAFENLVDDPGDGAVRVEEGILAVEDIFENAGSLHVQTGAELQLDPGEGPLRADFLTNTNVVIVEDGSVLAIAGETTVLKNAFGGVVRLQGTGEIVGTGALHNYGLFVKEDLVKSRAVGHVTAVFENFSSDPGDGAIHVNDGTLWVEGEFTNSGSVIVHDAAAMLLDPGDGPLRGEGVATNRVGGDWFVAGTLTVATGASLTNYGIVALDSIASVVNEGLFDHRENAVLAGRGTFDNTGGVFTGGGVIRPGGSIGTLSFIGDFSQTATGEIEVEIGGTTPGSEHDRLAIIGNATLGGALYVTLLPGFLPMEGDSFAVITSGGVLARTSFDCLSGLDAPGDLFLEPVEETNLFALVARDSTSANGAPEATNDHDSTDAATPITIRVLVNDSDPEMQDLRVALVSTAGTSGSVTILPGDSLLLYTPVRSFSGQDAFMYTVTDCYGGADVAMVTVGVARVPRSWLVPGDQPTITDGLAAAWAKDTVIVSSGTYHEHDLAMKSGVVLRSETMNPASVVIDADSLGRVFSCTGLDSTTTVIGITFMGGYSANGAGAYVLHSDMTFDRCVFRGNYASSLGGGLSIDNCDPIIRHCAFEGNAAFAAAGGISLDSSNAIIESCLVVSNRVAYNGSALFIRSDAPAFRSCTFAGNVATDGTSGSVFYVIAAHPTLEHTIVCSNTGAKTATCASGGTISLSCCDVYGNSGGNYVGCFAGQGGINNNFSADPQFCQFGNADDPYAIMSGSPCAPDNNPACGLVGARPVGCGAVTGVADAPPPAYEYRLFANRPNPFNPTTTIRFSLPRAERATLVVYDIAGRRVATLADGVYGPGELDATWNGTDESGRDVASGIYFARLAAGEFAAVRKMVLLR
jgi:hypothetical protein